MKGDYHFWQDFFDTYQSLSNWMKFAWLIVPPAFLLALIALVLRYRLMKKQIEDTAARTLACTVTSDENGFLRIYTREGMDTLPAQTSKPTLLPRLDATPMRREPPSPPD